MKQERIKGIILDIDGVIVGEKVGFNSPDPHASVIKRLKSIKESGMNISLCTAKPYFSIMSIIESAKLDNLHITDGGSVVINPISSVIVSKHLIDKTLARQVIEMCLKNNIYVEFYTVDDYFIQSSQANTITKQHVHILQTEPKIVDDLVAEIERQEITKIMPIALDNSDKERVSQLYDNLGVNLSFNWGVHPVALPLQFGIITATGISKKQGLIDIANNSGISVDNMLGVGDSTSDWKFIELCKYAGATGNASNELKDLVKTKGEGNYCIGGHVDDNGVLEIFDFFAAKICKKIIESEDTE